MTMTDLGVECMVGLCLAAAMWWVARRRCRTHTEEPKTRFESVDPAKAMPLVDDASAAAAEDDALLAEGDACEERSDRTDASHQDDVATSLHEHQQSRELEDEDLDEDEDDAAETDLTDHDGDDEEEDEDEDAEGEDEEEEGVRMDAQMKEALARAEAMAAKMGVNAFSNMTESVMAMEEFLVLDAPLPSAQPGTEAERMQMEDPAASDAHHAQDEAQDEAEDAGEEELEEDDDLVNVENVEENEDGRDNQEAEQPAAALAATTEGEASGVMSTFWAQCENKDECNLCNTPFSFLVRRHHCRKCRASVCGGCSSNSAALAEFGGSVERVCDRCWATMQMAAADHHHDERGLVEDEEPQDKEKPLSS